VTRLASFVLAIVLIAAIPGLARPGESPRPSKRYKAMTHSVGTATWAILDRDGANRQVTRYLSSLGHGETGTGTAASPAFTLSADRVVFTICGHDGQGGGLEKNFIALVDASSGAVLEKSCAPGSDPMVPGTWDVKGLKGKKVRIEVTDGVAQGAFAWLGIGKIDAGPGMKVDFQAGMPADWTLSAAPPDLRTREVKGGVPFLDQQSNMVPDAGAARIPCGFQARRIFFLGCTVPSGKPLAHRGDIDIFYKDGSSERYPLIVGFTLECEYKLPSKSKALHVRPSGDEYLYYLVVAPKPVAIDRIELRRNPEIPGAPLVCGITVETDAVSEALEALPDCAPDAAETAWIESHALSARLPDMEAISAEIRRAHKMN